MISRDKEYRPISFPTPTFTTIFKFYKNTGRTAVTSATVQELNFSRIKSSLRVIQEISYLRFQFYSNTSRCFSVTNTHTFKLSHLGIPNIHVIVSCSNYLKVKLVFTRNPFIFACLFTCINALYDHVL